MLDFDQLADQHAAKLKQSAETWRKAVWGAGFQKLTASLSDGEVEQLISYCPTAGHLEWVSGYLEKKSGGGSPFTVLRDEASKAGVAVEAWVHNCFSSGLNS